MSEEIKTEALAQLDPSHPNYVSREIPEIVRDKLAVYRENEDNDLIGNSLFQHLYEKDSNLASAKAMDKNFHGYNSMREAFNEAYGPGAISGKVGGGTVTPMQTSSGNDGGGGGGTVVNTLPASNLPGANTDSTLAILQRR